MANFPDALPLSLGKQAIKRRGRRGGEGETYFHAQRLCDSDHTPCVTPKGFQLVGEEKELSLFEVYGRPVYPAFRGDIHPWRLWLASGRVKEHYMCSWVVPQAEEAVETRAGWIQPRGDRR